jgi:acetyl-CoA acetyltransferase
VAVSPAVRDAVIMLGCMEVQTGVADLVLAGGAESMSHAEFYAMGMRWGVKGGSVTLEDRRGQGMSAIFENVAPTGG